MTTKSVLGKEILEAKNSKKDYPTRDPLFDLVGTLTAKEANELKGYIAETRKRMREGVERTAARLR